MNTFFFPPHSYTSAWEKKKKKEERLQWKISCYLQIRNRIREFVRKKCKNKMQLPKYSVQKRAKSHIVLCYSFVFFIFGGTGILIKLNEYTFSISKQENIFVSQLFSRRRPAAQHSSQHLVLVGIVVCMEHDGESKNIYESGF